MIRLELIVEVKANNRHWYTYDILLDGDVIVADSRDPEHDAARALLARGIKGEAELAVDCKPRSRINIEKAAPWSVGSNLERYRWKPPEVSDSSPRTAQEPSVGSELPEAA